MASKAHDDRLNYHVGICRQILRLAILLETCRLDDLR